MGKNVRIPVAVVVLCVAILIAGCAKKTLIREEPIFVTKEKPAAMERAAGEAAMERPSATEPALAGEVLPQESLRRELAESQATRQELAKELAKEPAKEVAALPTKGAIDFEDIHFSFDKYDLNPEARAVLKKLASWLLAHKSYAVAIEGHCDERGTTEYNLALGQRRATEAMRYLADLGTEVKRIKTISYGEEMPLDPGHNEDAWAKNRRDHFVVNLQN